jgi:hypothetical protein
MKAVIFNCLNLRNINLEIQPLKITAESYCRFPCAKKPELIELSYKTSSRKKLVKLTPMNMTEES